MNVFRFVVNFKPTADFQPEALQKAIQTHLAEIGIPLIHFSCNGKDSCECVSEVKEFPNGFPYRAMIFGGLDKVFDGLDCPITCMPTTEMRFEEL